MIHSQAELQNFECGSDTQSHDLRQLIARSKKVEA